MSANLFISTSIVIFKQDLKILDQSFLCLQMAITKASYNFPVEFAVHLIDNDPASSLEVNIQHLAKESLLVNKLITFQYTKTGKNLGYGAANNIAINNCHSKYHLIMNPDVFVAEDTLLNAIQYMETHPEVGLLTPAVYGEDGERHYLCKKDPTIFDMYLRSFAPKFIKKLFRQRILEFEMRDKDYAQEILDVPFPTGCFMFARSEVLKKVHGFDEQFFLYYEDADLGRRILDVSHSAYVPQVKIIHKWARESRRRFKMLWIFIKSALLYWKKHGGLF